MCQSEACKAFLRELGDVCLKHGLSLSHEDGHGNFLVESFNADAYEWLLSAVEVPQPRT
jgi:hypothetical protein